MVENFPGRDQWKGASASEAWNRPGAVDEVVAFACAHESDWPISLHLDDGRYVGNAYVDDRPPHDRPLGIVRPRGPANGLIVRHGRRIAAWGDIDRPDTTFSVAKSFLALVCGLAIDDGLVRLDEPVAASMPDGDSGFASGANRGVTWRHLLQQTSEWQGTVWGIPDSVDHHRHFGAGEETRKPGATRLLGPPGSRWEYNDVRVNRLALSLLRVFRRPLPQVLRERLMEPIGASSGWEWHGYGNSTVDIDGEPMISVSGGGHWGGGLFICAADQARIGLLLLHRGRWQNRQLISERYIDELATPCALNPLYGYLWWLNTGCRLYPSAPESSIFAMGGGHHLVWVDREHDLVMVARWIDRSHVDELIAKVLALLPA